MRQLGWTRSIHAEEEDGGGGLYSCFVVGVGHGALGTVGQELRGRVVCVCAMVGLQDQCRLRLGWARSGELLVGQWSILVSQLPTHSGLAAAEPQSCGAFLDS